VFDDRLSKKASVDEHEYYTYMMNLIDLKRNGKLSIPVSRIWSRTHFWNDPARSSDEETNPSGRGNSRTLRSSSMIVA
jgi:hypothetical protein